MPLFPPKIGSRTRATHPESVSDTFGFPRFSILSAVTAPLEVLMFIDPIERTGGRRNPSHDPDALREVDQKSIS